MEAAELNFEVEQGQTWNYEFLIVLDPCGNIVDLEHRTLAMQIRKTYGGDVIKELTTENSGIILSHGDWKGDWDETIPYVVGDIVKYGDFYYICTHDNTGEIPYIECEAASNFWIVYRQILFSMDSEETEELVPRNYIYNLELYDTSMTPRIETKLTKGTFEIKPEVTI